MSYALPIIFRAAELIKSRNKSVTIVLGGIGPSGVAEALLDYCQAIDVIVVGEGEATFCELVNFLKSEKELDSVNGIVFRKDQKVVKTAARDRIPELSSLPLPDYSSIDMTKYRLIDTQFSRGCPYPCTFCDIAPYWQRKTTSRSINHFVEQLRSISEMHPGTDVFIVDDTFVLDRKQIMEFCRLMIKGRIDLKWGCYARVDLVDDELLNKMAESGCTKIFYGLESGSDRVLSQVKKRITTDKIVKKVKATLERIEFVTASFIWGFPDESFEELEDTAMVLAYLASVGANPQLNQVLPYSYSQLYHQYRDKIYFEPEYSSQLQFYKGDKQWLCEMIEERPDLYSAFYMIPTKEFQRKWEFLDSMGLNSHKMQEAYDHPVESEAYTLAF